MNKVEAAVCEHDRLPLASKEQPYLLETLKILSLFIQSL